MKQYSIGVVTYHARFENYFKPLVERLSRVFPDRKIICIANGHPDQQLQSNYLKKFRSFLDEIKNVEYFTYEQNQSLSKCWNQLIINCKTNGCLILNDDTQITELFREEFEHKIIEKDLPFSTINESWSHFFITKNIIKKIGWFDENFVGVGNEDADYMFRMCIKNVEIKDTECLGINNYVAPTENPSWKEVSKVSNNKYSAANRDYIQSKYLTADFNPEIDKFSYILHWKNGTQGFTPKNIDIREANYSLDILTNKDEETLEKIGHKRPHFKILWQMIVYGILKMIKKAYRFLKTK